MALFHLNVSSIGKGAGSSAVASAAYRSCSQLIQSVIDSQTGLKIVLVHNFSNKQGLAFSQIFAPAGVADWCNDREKLWNKVEERETHIKGRFARDIKLALQKEFTLEQNVQLLSEYVKSTFVKDGIIADVNIHMDDPNNPHAHIMLTTRTLEINDNDEWVFGNKNRLLDSNGWLKYIRGQWADINNKYFAIYDIDKTITHESYETRGLEFIRSTIHEGAARHIEDVNNALERTEYNRNIVSENLQYIKNNPGQVIQAIAKNKSGSSGVFSRNDLFKSVDDFLNEIATRGGDHRVLVDEARAAIFAECDKIFKGINQSGLELDKELELCRDSNSELDFYSRDIGKNSSITNNGNNYIANRKGNLSEISAIQENIISLIEDFFKRTENSINVSDEFEFIKLNSIKLVEEVSKNKAVFSKADLAKVLDTHINEAILMKLDNENIELLDKAKGEILEKYEVLLHELINSSEIIKLVEIDLEGREVYTTKRQLCLEKEFINNVEQLAKSKRHSLHLKSLSKEEVSFGAKIVSGLENMLSSNVVGVFEKTIDQVFGNKKELALSEEQSSAVLKLVNGSDIISLSGMPGTGKSTVMAKLVKEYKAHGYEVVGAAVSAAAAMNLGAEAGIYSTTLSKWKYDWDLRAELETRGEDVKRLLPYLTNKTILIVDEMSMVDLHMFNYITSKVLQAKTKIVSIGDNNQFAALGVGGASEMIACKAENVVLTELFRQQSGLDKEITRKLANYRVDEALILLGNEGKIKVADSLGLSKQELVNDYINQMHKLDTKPDVSSSKESAVIIAYRNAEVRALNLEIRERLLSSGLLYSKNYEAKGKEFIGSRGKMLISPGERIVFTKNHRYMGVLNGQIGRVVEIISDSSLRVQILGKTSGEKKTVIINNTKFEDFDYGYAITSHKSQGKTYDHSYILLDSSVGYEAFNVMATRHRLSSVFYIAKDVLNNIINRKFESLKDIQHQNGELDGNKNAALFELLVKRNPNPLAHDYLDYEKKAEVMQIKEYLEIRNAASSIYRQLLEWREDEKIKGNFFELWDNSELWAEFKDLAEKRGNAAKEIIEGYQHYQKYINSSLINYATLLSHAKEATIEFDYLSVNNAIDNIPQIEGIKSEYQKLLDLHQSYLNNPTYKTANSLYAKAEAIIAVDQEYKSKVAHLSKEISLLENVKWELESQRQANISYRDDFKYFLDNTYKEGSKVALANWKTLKNEIGFSKALAKVKEKPESLGGLLGVGLGKMLSINDKRAVAVFNLRSLVTRLEGYEKAFDLEQKLNNEIHQKNTMELEPLKEQYQHLSSSKLLSPKQERFLDKLLEQKENVTLQFQFNDQLKPGAEELEKLKAVVNKNNKSNRPEQELQQQSKISDIINLKTQENTEVAVNEGLRSNKSTKAQLNKNYINSKISAAEMHAKLADNIIELAQVLLPAMSDKKIIMDKNTIKCGSINIVLHGDKRGLWSRFSRVDEKGNLFDLIRISQKLANKKESVEWSKAYLGLDKNNYLASEGQLKAHKISNLNNKDVGLIKENVKILSPVPQDAAVFNPRALFAHQLSKNNKSLRIEEVYAYRNVKNQLCGYVVRIRDIETDKKLTLPAVYTENHHGIKSWRSKGLGDDRCLYNEQRLHGSNKPVLIVEGEKTADITQSLYSEFDVITWSGGANGYNKSNWSVLKDKQVTIWPDNDQAGLNAAYGIKSLLEAKNITKAKIIDLKEIEFLPEKWDLADNLPEDVRQHQITGALFSAEGISNSIRIKRTFSDYMECRQNHYKEDLENKAISSLNEYMLEKETIKYKLHYEGILLKDKLKEQAIISGLDEAFISMDANKLVQTNIKTLNLPPDAKAEEIVNQVQHDLAQLHKATPKAILAEVTEAALVHAVKIMNEHNKLQQSNELDNQVNNEQIKKPFTLTHADLPILALSLASDILSHSHNHDNVNLSTKNIQALNNCADDMHNINQEHHAQIKLSQSIDFAKNFFKGHLEQDSIDFEQHQQRQQMMQRQMNQHQSIEI